MMRELYNYGRENVTFFWHFFFPRTLEDNLCNSKTGANRLKVIGP
ncbi:hypothetical protein Lalb_Chr18g0044921 [Lupinus albus]|uniref:Uncharacterized protein n=1 Tax=Lupinus albus TaxID=3870 RepID=A0A6A4NNA6_LUPAL|nr:hypothetical protein Lalb_Chr18g0044921 [Lupinus albus]